MTSTNPPGYAEVHLYGQDAWHDNVYIVGTEDGLKRLMLAIRVALLNGRSNIQAATSDGEGYTLNVDVISEGDYPRLAVPYANDFAIERRKEAIAPWKPEWVNPVVNGENKDEHT